MTKPSQKLKTTEERVKASKRGTWKPADPNAPVTMMIGGRPRAKSNGDVGLSQEQREFYDYLGGDRRPRASGDQTLGQARNAFAFDFREACQFEGIDPPSEEAVLAELGKREREAPPDR